MKVKSSRGTCTYIYIDFHEVPERQHLYHSYIEQTMFFLSILCNTHLYTTTAVARHCTRMISLP